MAGPRVLIIDDDVELLRQMSVAFVNAGYEVRVALDGQAGLRQFLADPADLVVTDVIMPNREGIETIVALRKACPSVKLLAISGGYRAGSGDFLKLAKHVGSDGVLAKPFRLSDLVKLASSVLEAKSIGAAA